jgi:hypothetical protein
MTVVTAQISESVQMLIDSRLDTIDRMLLGRLPRQDRLAIVTEAESQIHELLHASDGEDLTREDVLAVLARLDPPEAYLPDDSESTIGVAPRTTASRRTPKIPQERRNIGRVSGILGLVSFALVLMFPLALFAADSMGSVTAALLLLAGTIALTFTVSILGLVLGVHGQKGGVWAIVGIVLAAITLLVSLVETVYLLWIISSLGGR